MDGNLRGREGIHRIQELATDETVQACRDYLVSIKVL